MKYELIRYEIVKETETDVNGNYSATIVVYLKHIDDFIPPFVKEIEVQSCNTETGYEVDLKRKKAVEDFLEQINE